MARSTNLIVPEITTAAGVRVLQERLDLLRGATRGAVDLSYDAGYLAANGGDYTEPVVFARPANAVQHSDEADPAGALTAVALSQAKGMTPRQTQVAYYSWSRDEVMRGKMTPAQYSMALAGFLADDKLVRIRDNVIACGVAAIDSMDTPSANYHIIDNSRGKGAGAAVTFTFARLNALLGKMGDAREQIVALVMHSAVLTDLIGDGIANYKVDTVAGMMIVTGGSLGMGRAIIACDSSVLYNELTSTYYTEYFVLGLGAGALTARIIGEDPMEITSVTTTKVKSWTARQDFDIEYAVSGMKWESGTPIINPTNAELATAANWDEFLGDHRECKIVKGIYNVTQ